MEGGPIVRVIEGPLRGQEFPITEQGICVGRDTANEICINDANVSRQHACVRIHNGAVWVQDNGSRNGVFVNGQRVPDHKQLKTGDRFAVGPATFEVAIASAAAPAPVAEEPARRSVMPLLLGGLAGLGLVLCVGGAVLALVFRFQ